MGPEVGPGAWMDLEVDVDVHMEGREGSQACAAAGVGSPGAQSSRAATSHGEDRAGHGGRGRLPDPPPAPASSQPPCGVRDRRTGQRLTLASLVRSGAVSANPGGGGRLVCSGDTAGSAGAGPGTSVVRE